MILSTNSEVPILVTGAHRSGTTWTSKMLGLAKDTIVAEEPFNVEPGNFALGGLADHHFIYAPELDQVEAERTFRMIYNKETGRIFKRRSIQHYLKCSRAGRLIIKDPIACLSSAWIADRFDIDVVAMVRHPCAFTESLRRMNWEPDLSQLFTSQRMLVKDFLKPMMPLIRACDTDFDSRCAVTWKILYHVLSHFIAAHPRWIVKTHEALSLEPIEEFQDLYARLSLPWSDDVARKIEAYTGCENRRSVEARKHHCLHRDSRANAFRWKHQMTVEQIQHIKNITYPEWTEHYTEAHWALPEYYYATESAS